MHTTLADDSRFSTSLCSAPCESRTVLSSPRTRAPRGPALWICSGCSRARHRRAWRFDCLFCSSGPRMSARTLESPRCTPCRPNLPTHGSRHREAACRPLANHEHWPPSPRPNESALCRCPPRHAPSFRSATDCLYASNAFQGHQLQPWNHLLHFVQKLLLACFHAVFLKTLGSEGRLAHVGQSPLSGVNFFDNDWILVQRNQPELIRVALIHNLAVGNITDLRRGFPAVFVLIRQPVLKHVNKLGVNQIPCPVVRVRFSVSNSEIVRMAVTN